MANPFDERKGMVSLLGEAMHSSGFSRRGFSRGRPLSRISGYPVSKPEKKSDGSAPSRRSYWKYFMVFVLVIGLVGVGLYASQHSKTKQATFLATLFGLKGNTAKKGAGKSTYKGFGADDDDDDFGFGSSKKSNSFSFGSGESTTKSKGSKFGFGSSSNSKQSALDDLDFGLGGGTGFGSDSATKPGVGWGSKSSSKTTPEKATSVFDDEEDDEDFGSSKSYGNKEFGFGSSTKTSTSKSKTFGNPTTLGMSDSASKAGKTGGGWNSKGSKGQLFDSEDDEGGFNSGQKSYSAAGKKASNLPTFLPKSTSFDEDEDDDTSTNAFKSTSKGMSGKTGATSKFSMPGTQKYPSSFGSSASSEEEDEEEQAVESSKGRSKGSMSRPVNKKPWATEDEDEEEAADDVFKLAAKPTKQKKSSTKTKSSSTKKTKKPVAAEVDDSEDEEEEEPPPVRSKKTARKAKASKQSDTEVDEEEDVPQKARTRTPRNRRYDDDDDYEGKSHRYQFGWRARDTRRNARRGADYYDSTSGYRRGGSDYATDNYLRGSGNSVHHHHQPTYIISGGDSTNALQRHIADQAITAAATAQQQQQLATSQLAAMGQMGGQQAMPWGGQQGFATDAMMAGNAAGMHHMVGLPQMQQATSGMQAAQVNALPTLQVAGQQVFQPATGSDVGQVGAFMPNNLPQQQLQQQQQAQTQAGQQQQQPAVGQQGSQTFQPQTTYNAERSHLATDTRGGGNGAAGAQAAETVRLRQDAADGLVGPGAAAEEVDSSLGGEEARVRSACSNLGFPADVRRVAVVGNGPISLVQHQEIQRHDLVVRFGNLANYRCGDRVDMWMLRFNDTLERFEGPGDTLFCETSKVLQSAGRVWLLGGPAGSVQELEGDLPQLAQTPHSSMALSSWRDVYDKEVLKGKSKGSAVASSGWVAVMSSIACVPEGVAVHLYGFNWVPALGPTAAAERRFLKALASGGALVIHDTPCMEAYKCGECHVVKETQRGSYVCALPEDPSDGL